MLSPIVRLGGNSMFVREGVPLNIAVPVTRFSRYCEYKTIYFQTCTEYPRF